MLKEMFLSLTLLGFAGASSAAPEVRVKPQPETEKLKQHTLGSDVVQPAQPVAPQPPPPPAGCGDVVYQYVPGAVNELDLEQLKVANENLTLAIEVLTGQSLEDSGSIDDLLAARSIAILEHAVHLCGDEGCGGKQ